MMATRLPALLQMLILSSTCVQMARVPKIYNALITTNENLSPSQAYPVIEPVLRTSALGVPIQPLLVRPVYNYVPTTDSQVAEVKQDGQDQAGIKGTQLQYVDGSLFPVAYDPYLPYAYRHDLLYPALPSFFQQPVYVDVGHYAGSTHNNKKQTESAQPEQERQQEQVQPLPPSPPPQPNINFQKNPDIPDVIPPLPVRANS